jgi:hypothetical protein
MRTVVDRLRHELSNRLRHLHNDLDRIEILATAIEAFSKPVPDYEAGFHHFGPFKRELDRFELSDKERHGKGH